MPGAMHERWAVVSTVDPVDLNASTASGDVIDMSLFHEVLIIILNGVINASGSNTWTVTESVNSNGSSSSGLTVATAQAIDGNSDNKVYLIRVGAEAMTKRYLVITNAGSAHSQLGAMVALGRPRFGPATDVDLTDVQTVVSNPA